MNVPSLLPLASAAVAPVVERVIDGVAEGISFLNVLHGESETEAVDSSDATAERSSQNGFAELVDRVRERFSRLGLDLSTPMRLKQDGRGRVVVDGDHPERVLAESIFGSDVELQNLFASVAKAATEANANDSNVTKEFRLVLGPTEASIEFV